MPIIQCLDCGNGVSDAAAACPRCGRPPVALTVYVPTVASNVGTARYSAERHVCVMFGALILLAGPFLPWATLGRLSASGVEKTDGEALILSGLGLIAMLVSIVSMGQRRDQAGWACGIAGGFGLLLTYYYYDGLSTQLDGLRDGLLSPQIGYGVYACFAGCALILMGLAASLGRKRS